jgi:hypothetical protein
LHVSYGYHFTPWNYLMMLFGKFGVKSHSKKHEFHTFHPISRRGIRSIYWRRAVAVFIALFSYLLLFLGIIAVAVAICAWLLFWLNPQDQVRSTMDMIVSTILPAAMVWTGLAGRKWAHSILAPGGINRIARWPIEFVRFRYESVTPQKLSDPYPRA